MHTHAHSCTLAAGGDSGQERCPVFREPEAEGLRSQDSGACAVPEELRDMLKFEQVNQKGD